MSVFGEGNRALPSEGQLCCSMCQREIYFSNNKTDFFVISSASSRQKSGLSLRGQGVQQACLKVERKAKHAHRRFYAQGRERYDTITLFAYTNIGSVLMTTRIRTLRTQDCCGGFVELMVSGPQRPPRLSRLVGAGPKRQRRLLLSVSLSWKNELWIVGDYRR